jgi:Zn-dependent protease
LLHATTLEQLSSSARLHEERREYAEARGDWLKALELLPPDSSQAEWINGNLKRLETLAGAASAVDRHAWAKKFGPFAPLIVLLANSKFLLALFKLKFLLSLGAFVAFYWALYGVRFGIGFAILILLHEMGHFIEIKRRGLPAEMPVFLPGLGAYVRWTALGVSKQTRAYVSLAGPMAGCLGAVACALIWLKTGDALWLGLASLSAMLNVLNLIPIWVLDGSQAIIALNRN